MAITPLCELGIVPIVHRTKQARSLSAVKTRDGKDQRQSQVCLLGNHKLWPHHAFEIVKCVHMLAVLMGTTALVLS